MLFSIGASLLMFLWRTTLPWKPRYRSPARGGQGMRVSNPPPLIQRGRQGFPKENGGAIKQSSPWPSQDNSPLSAWELKLSTKWMWEAPGLVQSVGREIPETGKAERALGKTKDKHGVERRVGNEPLRRENRPRGSYSKFPSNLSAPLLKSLHQMALFSRCEEFCFGF